MTKIVYLNDEHAQASKRFAKNAKVFGSEEYLMWKEYRMDFPKAIMVVKEIKKNHGKKTNRNMTYENMKIYILYLYLVGNADGYNLDFSPQAVNNAIGMPLSTTRDQRRLLIEKGYLVPHAEGSNRYDFYETPHRPTEEKVERRTMPTYIAEDGTEFVF